MRQGIRLGKNKEIPEETQNKRSDSIQRIYAKTAIAKGFSNQVKEVLFIAVVHNIDRSIKDFVMRISTELAEDKNPLR